jgi:hypothetical protein
MRNADIRNPDRDADRRLTVNVSMISAFSTNRWKGDPESFFSSKTAAAGFKDMKFVQKWSDVFSFSFQHHVEDEKK